MRDKILVLDDYLPVRKIIKSKLKKYSLVFKNFKNQKELNKYLAKEQFFAIYSTFGFSLDKTSLRYSRERLNFIISPTTGTEHIDLDYCKNHKIKVLTLKNESFLKDIPATAELTWALILALAKNLFRFSNDVIYKKKWERNSYLNHDLKENTIGIIGYGRIGKIIAKYAKAFGMKIFVYEQNLKKRKKLNQIEFSSIKKILKCKYVTIHIPLENNHNFLSKKLLKYINKETYLINTSRGNLINEKNLINLIKSKSFKGLAFDVLPDDVFWKNKIPNKYDFLKNKDLNFIITPHIGGNTFESRSKTTNFIINKFLKHVRIY